MPERAFYRLQILTNAELLFPTHAPKLVTTDSGGRRILLVSSTTGQVLHEHNDTLTVEFAKLLSQTERLLAAKVRGGICGAGQGWVAKGGMTDEAEELRKENEVQLAEEKWARKLEGVEARLAEKRMREELERRIRKRDEGANTPATSFGFCYDMEVGENCVLVFYGTEKREGERLEIYAGGIGPCSSTVYQTCNMSPAHVHQ